MSERLPLSVRSLLAVDRVVAAALAVREEFLFAVCSTADRDAVGRVIYAKDALYLPSSDFYRAGLMDWETSLISDPSFPRAGRILVGAAGAGREMRALHTLGYRTTGFDPSSVLVTAGRAMTEAAGAELIVASYNDVVTAAQHSTGPLAALGRNDPIAGIILSFGSVSYLIDADERRKLFASLATIAPGAPIAFSFLSENYRAGRRPTLLRAVAKGLSRMLGTTPRQPMQRFLAHAGFMGLVTEQEVREIALHIGYDVAMLSLLPYPHALLTQR